MSTQLQKQVDKQKKEAEKKFSSWFMSKFTKKGKTQYIRDNDERTAEAERLRKQKPTPTSSSSVSTSSSSTSSGSKRDVKRPTNAVYSPKGSSRGSLQRQQSFLRAQLLEMKRHSQEVLLHARSRGDSSDDEEYDDVHSVLGDDEDGSTTAPINALRKSRSKTRMRRSATSDSDHSDGNQTDDDEEKKGGDDDTDDEDNNHHGRKSLRNSFTSGSGSKRNSFTGGGSGSQRNSFTGGGSGSQRNSLTDELERRSSRATSLYEEAIHALEEVLHPEQAQNRMTRSDSATKRLFARPDSEWI